MNSIWAFAKLSQDPGDEFIAAWLRGAEKKVYGFSSQELVNSIWVFASLELEIPTFLTDKIPLYKFDHLQSSSLLLVDLYQKFLAEEKHNSLIEIVDNAKPLTTVNSNMVSRSEKVFGKILPSERLETSYVISNTNNLMIVDFCYPDQKVVIQYDGPSHFIGEKENGSTKLNSTILKKLGYNVIRVSQKDYREDYKIKFYKTDGESSETTCNKDKISIIMKGLIDSNIEIAEVKLEASLDMNFNLPHSAQLLDEATIAHMPALGTAQATQAAISEDL